MKMEKIKREGLGIGEAERFHIFLEKAMGCLHRGIYFVTVHLHYMGEDRLDS